MFFHLVPPQTNVRNLSSLYVEKVSRASGRLFSLMGKIAIAVSIATITVSIEMKI